jgi:hypothetical protein
LFITRDNIEGIFNKNDVPENLDLLSVDIDGNDYWIWKAISNYKPRVVVVEYNSTINPTREWIMPYNENRVWD